MYRTVSVDVDLMLDLVCSSAPELAIRVGDQCVVESDRSLEYGRVTSIREAEGTQPDDRRLSRVLRRATLQDQAKANENGVMSRIAMNKCTEAVKKTGIDVHPVKAQYNFDRTVLTVIVTAEQKVDFRELAQNLGNELRTRVDIRGIGVRDEAGMIGGMGFCGRPLCCAVWLRTFESVNVRMAKLQGVSLSPNAINGQCGRLKCCLKYENECYREIGKHVPMEGTTVVCPDGRGLVVARDILRQGVKVRLEDKRMVEYGTADVKPGLRPGIDRDGRMKDEHSASEWAESGPAGEAGTGTVRTEDSQCHCCGGAQACPSAGSEGRCIPEQR